MRRKRFSLLAIVAATLLIIGVAVAIGLGGEDDSDPKFDPIAGAFTENFSILDRPAAPTDRLPEQVANAVESMGAADAARLAGTFRDVELFVYPAHGSEGICLAVVRDAETGDWVSSCPSRDIAAAGKYAVKLQRGNLDTPAIYAGIVPDGVTSVIDGGTTTEIGSNVFAVHRNGGVSIGTLTFVAADGSQSRVTYNPDIPPPTE